MKSRVSECEQRKSMQFNNSWLDFISRKLSMLKLLLPRFEKTPFVLLSGAKQLQTFELLGLSVVDDDSKFDELDAKKALALELLSNHKDGTEVNLALSSANASQNARWI
ncbi:hypothetical protein Leryth_002858 [Lithospermum erythrorhizon]|nr:hypothetical protein Leryth_002858 [Lithospermum erythrorhizon]